MKNQIAIALIALTSCSQQSELYCDRTTACIAGHPVCDLEGICEASGMVANSCIPEACWDAGAATGDGAVSDADPLAPDADPLAPDAGGGADAAPLPDPIAKAFGASNIDIASSVAVDSSGGIIVAGTLAGTVDFGGGPRSGGGFVAKFTQSGSHVWSKALPNAVQGAVVDSNDDVIIAGSFTGTINLGGQNLTSLNGSQDIVVAKFASSNGAHVWSKGYGGTGTDEGVAVTLDSAGNPVVTGRFSGTVNFGGENLQSAGSADVFVVKVRSTNGNHIWSDGFGGASSDAGRAVALDASDNILLAGEFNLTVDFGVDSLTTAGEGDVFVLKITSAGNREWVAQLGGSVGTDSPTAIVVADDGDPIVAGAFQGMATIGSETLTSNGTQDAFVVRLQSGDGSADWAKNFGGSGSDYAAALFEDGGDVWVGGNFRATVNFGGGAKTSAGESDMFLLKLGSNGGYLRAETYGGTGIDNLEAVAAAGPSSVVLGGGFRNSMSIGGEVLQSAGETDIFFARINLP